MFMEFGIYIKSPKPISRAYFINPPPVNTNITASHFDHTPWGTLYMMIPMNCNMVFNKYFVARKTWRSAFIFFREEV
jgi:hypothetical protein